MHHTREFLQIFWMTFGSFVCANPSILSCTRHRTYKYVDKRTYPCESLCTMICSNSIECGGALKTKGRMSITIVQIHSLSSCSFLLQFKALWFATECANICSRYVYCLCEIRVCVTHKHYFVCWLPFLFVCSPSVRISPYLSVTHAQHFIIHVLTHKKEYLSFTKTVWTKADDAMRSFEELNKTNCGLMCCCLTP